MDAIASLVFSVIILRSLTRHGFSTRRNFILGSTLSAIPLPASAYCLVYLGLAAVGTRIAGHGFTDGAAGLAYAAEAGLGPIGQTVFSAVTILACLTTAVGLIGSSSQYFRKLFPKISHKAMVAVQCLVALALANLGLEEIPGNCHPD